jgi:iduronate 2-sulfatase
VAKLKEKLATHPEAKPQITSKKLAETATPNNNGNTQDRAQLFKTRDKDGDGKLTREEFLANQKNPEAAEKRLSRFDKDGDGILTRDEFISATN